MGDRKLQQILRPRRSRAVVKGILREMQRVKFGYFKLHALPILMTCLSQGLGERHEALLKGAALGRRLESDRRIFR